MIAAFEELVVCQADVSGLAVGILQLELKHAHLATLFVSLASHCLKLGEQPCVL